MSLLCQLEGAGWRVAVDRHRAPAARWSAGGDGGRGVGLERVPDAAGEVAFQAADGVAAGLAFGLSAREVGGGLGVEAAFGDGEAVERAVELAVAAAVEAVALGASAISHSASVLVVDPSSGGRAVPEVSRHWKATTSGLPPACASSPRPAPTTRSWSSAPPTSDRSPFSARRSRRLRAVGARAAGNGLCGRPQRVDEAVGIRTRVHHRRGPVPQPRQAVAHSGTRARFDSGRPTSRPHAGSEAGRRAWVDGCSAEGFTARRRPGMTATRRSGARCTSSRPGSVHAHGCDDRRRIGRAGRAAHADGQDRSARLSCGCAVVREAVGRRDIPAASASVPNRARFGHAAR